MSGTSMDRDAELELRIAEWLEDGPFIAPAASVEAVLDEVRRQPRRHATLERLRRALQGVPSGDAIEVGASRGAQHWFAIAASVVVAVGLLVTFGVSTLLPPGATEHPGGPATLAPSPSLHGSPNPTPSLAALPVEITGTSTCTEMDAGTMERVGTTRVTTGIVVKCSDRKSDPRISGIGYRYYTTEIDADGAQHWFGTATTENSGGMWNGIWTGYQAVDAVVLSNTTYWLGSGGYAGLQVRDWVDIGEEGVTITRPGILEKVGPIDANGVADCAAGSADASPAVGTNGPDQAFVCAVKVDDPRLSGTWSLSLTTTRHRDGSATVTGTARIENAAGAWDGRIAGSIAADGRTYQLSETSSGSGLYAGFSFSGTLAGPVTALALSGTVAPAP